MGENTYPKMRKDVTKMKLIPTLINDLFLVYQITF